MDTLLHNLTKMSETKAYVKDGHMITVSGKLINLFDPDPNMIDINDIAHGLSNTCRWNGHTGEFFSVAQHVVLGVEVCKRERRPQWVLHDSEETYFGDVIKPLKNMFPEIEKASITMRKLIYKQLGVEYIYDEEIERVDAYMLDWDYNTLIGKNFERGHCWSPEVAKDKFLEAFFMYC